MAKRKTKNTRKGVDATKKLGTFHLVLARAGMDDLPMLLTPSAIVARRYTNRTDLGNDLRAAADAIGVDTSIWLHLSVMTFKGGRPVEHRIFRDITDEEAEIANGVFKSKNRIIKPAVDGEISEKRVQTGPLWDLWSTHEAAESARAKEGK